MEASYRQLADYLVDLGIEKVAHSQKNYLAHLVAVYHLMENQGCNPMLCRAGMFHSIYGTELFQGFKIGLERREEVRGLIGDNAEKLAYCNCFMDRKSFDALLGQSDGAFVLRHRETGEDLELTLDQYDDLVRIHLYDWLEQVARSRHGWNYRRAEYRKMAERLGNPALEKYDVVFAGEPKAALPV